MDAETVILQMVEASSEPVTRKDIVKDVKSRVVSTTSSCKKKEVKKILKKLVKEGKIALAPGETKVYCRSSSKRKVKVVTAGSSSSKAKEEDASKNADSRPVPIAETLRRRKKVPESKAKEKQDDNMEDKVDIDEEIRRLEAELNADSDDDSEDDENDEDSSTGSHQQVRNTASSSDEPAGLISLSTFATDRIAALPDTCLPTNKRRKLKAIDGTESEEPKAKRRNKKSSSETMISDGLRAAVKQVLDGYTPRSNEKIPFYCRVCAKQYKNGDEFFDHKKTDFHRAAVDLEQKASYCKLCRKQLTSPVQLKEHLFSKPHKDRLRMLKSRQPPRKR